MITATGGLKNLMLTRFLFKQLCEGVQHIHNVGGYSHLDLKLENILIGNDFKLKICDFGFAMDKTTMIQKKYGTPCYMAPEIIQNASSGYFGEQADIYSLGVILFIIYFGQPPFNKADERDNYYRLYKKKSSAFFNVHPTIKRAKAELKLDEIDTDLVHLLNLLFSDDLSVRPKCLDEVLKHAFLNSSENKADEETKDLSSTNNEHREFKFLVERMQSIR